MHLFYVSSESFGWLSVEAWGFIFARKVGASAPLGLYFSPSLLLPDPAWL